MKHNLTRFYRKSPAVFNDFIIVIVITILTYLIALAVNLFEIMAAWARQFEQGQLDELLPVLLILAVALSIFSFRRWRELNHEIFERTAVAQRLKESLAQLEEAKGRAEELTQTLQTERDILTIIMENTRTHLAYLDHEFNFVRVNLAYAQGSGHGKEQLIGHNHFELFPNPANQAIFQQVKDTGQPVEFYAKPFEYPDQPARGVTYWDWSLVPVKNISGQVQGLVFSLQEVTERKKMEVALRRSHEELEARVQERTGELSKANQELQYQAYLLANVSDAIVAVDQQGLVTAWNHAAEEMYGWPAAAAIGYPFTEQVDTTFIGTDWAEVKRTMAQTGRWRGEVGHVLANGTSLICEVTTMALKDEDSLITGYMGVVRDITRRKQMEQALYEREHAYRTLAENLPGIVYRVFVREDHRMEFFNKMAETVIGYKAEKLGLGRVCPIESLILPEDRARVITEVKRAVAEDKPFMVEYRLEHKNGSLRHVIEQGRPIHGLDGAPLYIDGIIFDITERKQAESKLRLQAQIIDQIHDAVVSTDLDGYVTSWNQGAVRLAEYLPEEALGRHISFIYPADQHDYLQYEVIAPLKTKGTHETEVKMQNKSGRIFYAHLSLSLLRNSAGVATGMIGYSMDITQRKQAEELMSLYIVRLEMLQKLDRAILGARSLEEIADVALHYGRQLLNSCQRASVVLYDLEANQAVWLAVSGSEESKLQKGKRTSMEFFGPLPDFEQARYLLVDDIQAKARPAGIDQHLLAEGLRSYLCLPLLFQGRLIGSLNFSSTTPKVFTEDEVEILSQVADPLAIALQNARLFDEVQAARERLQHLSQRLVEAQEAERRRIACELHDEIGQSLTAVKINLQGIQQRPDGAELGTRLAGSIEIVEHALQQVRNLSLDLRPSLLDDLGLVATLRWYLDRQAQWGGFSAQFVAPPAELSLCSELETTCFRIVQEALTNVLRHAQAHQVRVELQQHEAHLELTIQDDGVGFDVQEALNRAAQGSSLGLLSLLERVTLAGGQLDVESQLGQGTRIRVCCPLCSSDSPFAMTDKMTAGKQ